MNIIMYRNILTQHILQFEKCHVGWIFQQDSNPKLIKKFFVVKKVQVLELLSQSLDLNPIELL